MNERSWLERQLRSGERVLWSGHPETGLLFTGPDVALVPFSAIFATLSIGVLLGSLSRDPPRLDRVLVAVVFSILSVYLLIGRFPVRQWLKKGTQFVVTSQRLLILRRKVRGREVEAFELSQLGPTRRRIRRDGIGTVEFGDVAYWRTWYGNTGLEPLGTGERNPVPIFFDIRDAEDVAELVDDLRSKASS